MSSGAMALAAYRHVLRSTRIAFQGDFRTLTAARLEARNQFEKHRELLGDSAEAVKGIEHAEGVAKILRQNVAQGISDTGAEQPRFKLRLHDEIERGDNESVGMAGMGTLGRRARCS